MVAKNTRNYYFGKNSVALSTKHGAYSDPGLLRCTLRLQSLPQLPKVSDSLKELLVKYPKKTSGTIVGGSKKKFHKVNGFIAYRSFYTKNLSNGNAQRELSKELAKEWKCDKHRNTWSTYAAIYNSQIEDRSCKEPFVAWLLRSIGVNARKDIRIQRNARVEDVFINERN